MALIQNNKIDDGTITKRAEIYDDPKRPGLYLARFFDENDHQIGTSWGKKNQADIINNYMK